MKSFRSNIDDVSVCAAFIAHLTNPLSITLWQCNAEAAFDLVPTWSCYNGTNASEGVKLLRAHGDQTNTIDLSFVPSIEIDNVSCF
jgi:hypothetical protein